MSHPHIPGYTFVEHIGSGGFADVLLYEQDWPRQRVAVKVVRPDVALTEREKELFTAEANAMARLADHPYIVSVMTAGVTDAVDGRRPYLVMRYCPPPDLGVRVRSAPMSVADAVSTGIKLASAVETAHRAGILHRDIKPGNVLVTTYHEPALSDFGIAGNLTEVEGDHEVRISYPWSAPEMVDGRSNGTVASDVYSLGATIWNLLTGRSPFALPGGDNSTTALTARILHAPPPTTGRPDVPPALERLLQQCLAKQPTHRPQSALELARALQRIETTSGYARTPIAVGEDLPERTATPSRATDPEATRLKPVTISPSGPRPTVASPPPGADADAEGSRSGRTAIVAGIAAVAVVGALVAFALRGGGDDDPGADEPTAAPSTPLSVAPEVPVAPRVTGSRDGVEVQFAWIPGERARSGDGWEWRRTDTGESRRTDTRTVRFRADDRVCLQVRMIRGTFASGWTEKCV
jgi:serine/threonine protein kinase